MDDVSADQPHRCGIPTGCAHDPVLSRFRRRPRSMGSSREEHIRIPGRCPDIAHFRVAAADHNSLSSGGPGRTGAPASRSRTRHATPVGVITDTSPYVQTPTGAASRTGEFRKVERSASSCYRSTVTDVLLLGWPRHRADAVC